MKVYVVVHMQNDYPVGATVHETRAEAEAQERAIKEASKLAVPPSPYQFIYSRGYIFETTARNNP